MLKVNKTCRDYTRDLMRLSRSTLSIADCHVVSRIALNLPRSEGSQILGATMFACRNHLACKRALNGVDEPHANLR